MNGSNEFSEKSNIKSPYIIWKNNKNKINYTYRNGTLDKYLLKHTVHI